MKRLLRTLVKSIASNRYGWFFLRPMVKVGKYIDFQKNESEYYYNIAQLERKFKNLLKEPIVLSGPFKGLKYPDFNSFGSTIFPKIIGSYERELQPLIQKLCETGYTTVVDIGSAEGYYAIGVAMRIKNARVWAFDIDKMANQYCKEMAILNKVEDRVVIQSRCTPLTLAQIDFGAKGLIICDCEGFEKELFNKGMIDQFENCDLLIEIHDFIDINISGYIEALFAPSHTIRKFRSIDDIEKAKTYRYPILETLSLEERKQILKESRPSIMEWFFLKSKRKTEDV